MVDAAMCVVVAGSGRSVTDTELLGAGSPLVEMGRTVDETRGGFEDEWSRLLLVDGTKEAEPTVMLGTGVVTVAPVGRSTSTSMTAVSLLEGGRKNTERSAVPRAAARTMGLSGIKRDKELEGVA